MIFYPCSKCNKKSVIVEGDICEDCIFLMTTSTEEEIIEKVLKETRKNHRKLLNEDNEEKRARFSFDEDCVLFAIQKALSLSQQETQKKVEKLKELLFAYKRAEPSLFKEIDAIFSEEEK